MHMIKGPVYKCSNWETFLEIVQIVTSVKIVNYNQNYFPSMYYLRLVNILVGQFM